MSPMAPRPRSALKHTMVISTPACNWAVILLARNDGFLSLQFQTSKALPFLPLPTPAISCPCCSLLLSLMAGSLPHRPPPLRRMRMRMMMRPMTPLQQTAPRPNSTSSVQQHPLLLRHHQHQQQTLQQLVQAAVLEAACPATHVRGGSHQQQQQGQ